MERYSYAEAQNPLRYSKSNLSELVVFHIKYKIMAGDLKGGDRITETEISEELEISRAPVREAMRELNMQGILFFSPRRGSQIQELTQMDVEEIFSIRIPLEIQVLTIVFEQKLIGEAELKELEALNEELLSHRSRQGDVRELTYQLNANDLSFHKFFWTKSKSFRRVAILENQFFQLLTGMNKDLSTLGSIEEKYQQHKAIIEAFRRNSLSDIVGAFRDHMNAYLEVITKL